MGKSGRIAIRTDKASYVGGELITGKIFFEAFETIKCRGVELRVKGYEKTEWEETKTRMNDEGEAETYTEEHEAKKEFFKDRMNLQSFPDQVEPGQYVVPFEYQLPDSLPGTFEEKSKHSLTKFEAKVLYKVKATLDVKFASDLKDTQKVIVHEKFDKNVKPVSDSKKGKVLLLCCIPRGECELKAWFDKNSYMPGETAQITAEIDNDSKVDVNNMVIKLMRKLTVRDKRGYSRKFVETMHTEKYEGVDAGKHKTRACALTIPEDTQPNTKSNYIKARYHVDVECDLPMAPDIEIHMPVKIFAPQPASWGSEGF